MCVSFLCCRQRPVLPPHWQALVRTWQRRRPRGHQRKEHAVQLLYFLEVRLLVGLVLQALRGW